MKLSEINHNGLRWINITEPDQEMVDFLRSNFSFHPLDFEDLLSKTQHPKLDAYKDYLFIILQFPVYENSRQIYKRTELNIFFGHDYLITITNGSLNTLENFFQTCQVDETSQNKFLTKGTGLLLYEILSLLMNGVFPIINQKYEFIFELEEDIFETPELKDMIQDIMILKRNIINIRRIILPQRSVLIELGTKHRDFIPEELTIYFDDVVDKIDKIINQLETADSYADILEDANETLITRNTNRVIKTLTIFSVIFLPLTLVTSYYGMNVPLPLQHDSHILTYINASLIATVVIMLGYFVKKRYL